MIPIAELKQDLDLVKNLGVIIEALKSGSAIQLRQFQLKPKPDEGFASALRVFFGMLSHYQVRHPLLDGGAVSSSCVVIITSDNGFVGELNSLIIGAAVKEIKGAEDEIVVIGERGWNYFEDQNQLFTAFPGISEDVKLSEVSSVGTYLMEGYLRQKFGRVVIVYPRAKSAGSWELAVQQLLPCGALLEQQKPVAGDSPAEEADTALLVEPSIDRVMEGLIYLWLEHSLRTIFWSSKFAEFGARLMHLEGSDQELIRTKQQLSLQYFKHLHSLTDKTIREILCARLSHKG
jgi:F-type H+-transporting ATPase subunit gamma